MGTHKLEIAEGGTSQGMERKPLSKGHLPTGVGRGRDKSGHRRKVTVKGALTAWRWQRDKVRTWKKSDQARGTHSLEMVQGGTSHDKERKQLSERHLHSGDSRGRDKSAHGKK